MDYFDYLCQTKPAGCTHFIVGVDYSFYVTDPPPSGFTYTTAGQCYGATFVLDDTFAKSAKPRHTVVDSKDVTPTK